MADFHFTAPHDTTGIHFSTGRELRADEKGIVTVPGDDPLTTQELVQLINAGFVPADSAPRPSQTPKAEPKTED